MLRRLASVPLALGVLVGLAACAATPAPIETKAAFASDAEAFAAAEATYRAYVDALNQVDLADPATFEAVYALTTGEANANARETFSRMHADGWTVSGNTTAALVELASVVADDGEIALAVCADVSDVTVNDPDGTSVVSPDRGDVQSMLIVLRPSTNTPAQLAIASLTARQDGPDCGP